MKLVEIFIGTELRGPARGRGRVVYIMRTPLDNGADYVSRPEISVDEDATESRLVLLALRDALRRMRFACEVVVHTECTYAAAAVNNMWPAGWRENNWTNARGRQVRDWCLWECILQELEDAGHVLRAVPGKHEFTLWMRSNIPRLAADINVFSAVEEKVVNLVSDRMEA